MDFSKIPLFQAITRKMDWLGQRQQVLARNIANVNTPGYKPKDVAAPDFGALLRGKGLDTRQQNSGVVPLVVTHPGHIGADPLEDPIVDREIEVTSPDAPKQLNGNAVVVETELMKVGKTAMEYQLTTNIYRKYIAMFQTAIGRRG